jgi:hypothetical protein
MLLVKRGWLNVDRSSLLQLILKALWRLDRQGFYDPIGQSSRFSFACFLSLGLIWLAGGTKCLPFRGARQPLRIVMSSCQDIWLIYSASIR